MRFAKDIASIHPSPIAGRPAAAEQTDRARAKRPFGSLRRVLAAVAGLVFGAAVMSSATAKAEEVDLLLVLAVDTSYSMDEDEQRLQRRGYVEAITSREVMAAIQEGLLGRIALAYTEWAGAGSQHVLVDWHVIGSAAEAEQFAAMLAEAPISRAYRTSIGEAIYHAVSVIEESPHTAPRKVIDISGDGPNNQGRPAPEARDAAVARGITINGLPLMLKRPFYGWFDIEELDHYYFTCVIGGPAAFSIPVRETAAFSEAIRRKLVLEIAGRPSVPDHASTEVRLWKAATGYDPYCLIGERLWQRRMMNGN